MAAKYQIVADALRAHIQTGKYADAAALPTEFAIAGEYQVSRQTVRQALALLAREGLIATRQGSGSRILRQTRDAAPQRRSIAVITTYISDYIFPSILREAETVFARHDCTPSLFATQNQVSVERKILQTLLTMKELDGVLVEGTKTALPNPNLDLYRKLMDRGVRLVFINGIYPELAHIPSVLADNYGGGRVLVDYLHQKGHQNIAGIFKNDDMQGTLRYAGYAEALRDLGLPFEDERVRWYNTEQRKDFLSESFVDSVLEGFQGCSAIVCYNDEVAIRVVSRLQKRGVRVPEEMAVVSFDNSQYSDLAPVRLTSLSHGSRNLGELAANLMLRLLQGEECRSETVPWQLVERESG